MHEHVKNFDEPTRRAFAAYMAKACLGVGVLPLLGSGSQAFALQSSGGKAKKAIYLFMSGGMTHLDTFDPKPGTKEQGPTQSIDTNVSGIRLSQHFPKLAQRMDKLSIIRSMTTNQGAHEQGRYLAHTSYAPRATIRHAAMGAWVAKVKGQINKNVPANIVINGGSDHPGAGYMDLKYAPLPIGNPTSGLRNSKLMGGVSEKDFKRRLNLVAKFGNQFLARYPYKEVQGYGAMYAEAIRLMRSEDVKAFDVKQEDSELRATYGNGNFGQGCLLARRLLERDVRFVEVQLGGWDTHVDNFDTIATKAPEVDNAVAALLDDLERTGLLDETVVVLTSEFGRSPKINERVGRDHHPAAFSSLMAGAGIRGGYVHGASDERGLYVDDGEVTVEDLNATFAHALGIPTDRIEYSASKRPFTIANDGEVIQKLLG
jgi:Protein of unknown function (DUF1501)